MSKTVPAWLYNPDQAPKLFHDQADYDYHVANGWRDSPAHPDFQQKPAEIPAIVDKTADVILPAPPVLEAELHEEPVENTPAPELEAE